MDTFGAFADAHQLSIYDTVYKPFHTASIDPDTLQHNTQDGQALNVMSLEDETEEAREYRREGHYVMVLGKRGGGECEGGDGEGEEGGGWGVSRRMWIGWCSCHWFNGRIIILI